jgi:NADH:ubiquinone oxidoreductase subunit K
VGFGSKIFYFGVLETRRENLVFINRCELLFYPFSINFFRFSSYPNQTKNKTAFGLDEFG